jgi:peptidoglycan/xylan/chitin deacetylase (PgdA/CDA1 family)
MKNKAFKLFSIFLLISQVALSACNANNGRNQETILANDAKEVVAFVYHRFGDDRYPSTNISIRDFEAHLNYLKTHDFQVLTLSDAIDYLKSDAPIQKTAVLTIDDGYKSFFDNGLPLLQQYEFPATLFINTETVGGGDYMGWEALKEAQKQSIEIGNHTHSHAYFLNMSEEQRYTNFENEILQTQKIIKSHLDFTAQVFAYPYGELDLKMKEIVEKAGFKAAAAQNSGVIYSGTDLMQCPRFPMSEFYADLEKFKGKAETKALRVIRQSASSSVLETNNNKPELELVIEKGNLRIDQLQCFIQGAKCEITQTNLNDQVTLKLSPKSTINNKRRTLYTITVPDSAGNWHWFSHLWVNPIVR